jgi:addiction module HigA family antidote
MYNPPHPGALLRELYLEPLGLSISGAARGLGVSRKTLSEFVLWNAFLKTKKGKLKIQQLY